MQCKICTSQTSIVFSATILNKYKNVPFFYCNRCEFLASQEPFWLQESYSKGISALDTGVVHRNLSSALKVSALVHFFFNKHTQFFDFGGGIGLFTRLMRDQGLDFYWQDMYTPNEIAQGFEFDRAPSKNFELATAFECFEHFVNPWEEIDKMLHYTSSILFTTSLLPSPIPSPAEWFYYSLDSGQHIAFYRKKTLQYIAKKLNLNFYTNNRMHLITHKKINHSLYSSILLLYRLLPSWYVNRTIKSKMKSDRSLLKERMRNLS